MNTEKIKIFNIFQGGSTCISASVCGVFARFCDKNIASRNRLCNTVKHENKRSGQDQRSGPLNGSQGRKGWDWECEAQNKGALPAHSQTCKRDTMAWKVSMIDYPNKRETAQSRDGQYPNRRQRLGLEPYDQLPVVQDTREELDPSIAAFAVIWSVLCIAVGVLVGYALWGTK